MDITGEVTLSDPFLSLATGSESRVFPLTVGNGFSINRTRRFMLIDLRYSRRSVKKSVAASIAICAYVRQTLIFRNCSELLQESWR